jgi:hypothetical protein
MDSHRLAWTCFGTITNVQVFNNQLSWGWTFWKIKFWGLHLFLYLLFDTNYVNLVMKPELLKTY